MTEHLHTRGADRRQARVLEAVGQGGAFGAGLVQRDEWARSAIHRAQNHRMLREANLVSNEPISKRLTTRMRRLFSIVVEARRVSETESPGAGGA